MGLIVEDGTARTDAESYASVAEADVYLAARGIADALWVDLDTEVKEAALRRGTDYMVQMYRDRWKGVPVKRMNPRQSLDWPRFSVFPETFGLATLPADEVPTEVKIACIELAYRATTIDLTADLQPGVVSSERVGPLGVTYVYTGQRQVRYPAVDRLLKQLLLDGSSSIQGDARLG